MPFISSKRLANMEKLLRELYDRLEPLSEQMRNVDASKAMPSDARIEISVQELHVQEVKLEELAFRMDSISIDDLSGSFNLGNNFAGKLGPRSGKKKREPDGPSLAHYAEAMNRTPKGYRMTFDPARRHKPNV